MVDREFCKDNGVPYPDEPIKEQWYPGGRGSCKSTRISVQLSALMAGCPKERADWHIVIARKIGNELRESVYNQMCWAIDKLGMRPYFKFQLSPLKIIRKDTQQEIIFKGLDDADKSKSIKLPFGYVRYLWLEEADQFAGTKEIRKFKQSVLRGGRYAQTFYSYNPPISAAAWVNKEALKPKWGKKVYKSTYLDVPPEWLGDEFLQEALDLKEDNPRLYEHEYLGVPTGTGAEVFPNLTAREITNEEISRFTCCRYGIDFGFRNDPSTIICTALERKTNTIYIWGEWYAFGQFEEQIAAEIKRRELAQRTIYADSAELRAIARLNALGCRLVVPVPKNEKGIAVDDGINWLRKHRIIIDPKRCPHSWEEYSMCEYIRTKDGQLTNLIPDKDNHCIDPTRYAYVNEIRYGNLPRQFAM